MRWSRKTHVDRHHRDGRRDWLARHPRPQLRDAREAARAQDRTPLRGRRPAVPSRDGRAARPGDPRRQHRAPTCRTATRSSRRCSRRSAARRRRSASRPTSTGTGEIGREFADALSERARAGVTVNVTIDWAGSVNMDDALLEADAGRRRAGGALPAAALVQPRPHEQPHAPQAAGDRRPRRLHRRRRHRRPVAGPRAGPGPLARHAFPRRRPGRRADPGGVQRQLDQDHGRGAQRRRLLPAAGRRSAAWTRTCSSARPPAAARACT